MQRSVQGQTAMTLQNETWKSTVPEPLSSSRGCGIGGAVDRFETSEKRGVEKFPHLVLDAPRQTFEMLGPPKRDKITRSATVWRKAAGARHLVQYGRAELHTDMQSKEAPFPMK